MGGSGFVIAGDGWVQVTPCGEFPHAGAGVTQVVDRETCDRIAAEFDGRRSDPNFPGVLVDFDHFSLDTDKSSEAAGWITELESRDSGLWARVRWSDSGLAAVQGGRFRLVSPVFPAPDACDDLGGGRIRPLKLVSVALTNEPNIKGARPIANRRPEGGGRKTEAGAKAKGDVISGPGAKKYMWLLGDVRKGPHCRECLKRHGQSKTLLEWLRMKPPLCHCRCSLAEVGKDVPEGHVPPAPGPSTVRPAKAVAANRWAKPWGDKARAASLAVRRARAAARKAAASGSPFERAVDALDAQIAAGSRGVPDGYEGPSFVEDTSAPLVRQAELSDTTPSLRDVVGAAPETGNAFVDFVNGGIGVASTFGTGAVAPAGGCGYGGGAQRAAAARRGAAASGTRRPALDWFRSVMPGRTAEPEPDPETRAAMDVEASKRNFRDRQAAERETLAAAIRRIRKAGRPGDGLEMLAAKQLREILKAAGGDPSAVPSANAPDPAAAAAAARSPRLRVQAELEAPEADAVREGFALYLRETVPPRAKGVDSYLHELDALAESAGREASKAKDALYAAQYALKGARAGSAGHDSAERGARVAAFDLQYATRASQRFSRTAADLRKSIADYLQAVREGNPLNWRAGDADYEAVWRGSRAGPENFYGGLQNRGWTDVARAASLAVRRAKAAARKVLDDWKARRDEIRRSVEESGREYQARRREREEDEARALKTEREKEAWRKRTESGERIPVLAPNADGDIVVDGRLTIMKGTPPEKVQEILRGYLAPDSRLLERAMESDERIRAAAVRKSEERKSRLTPGQRAERELEEERKMKRRLAKKVRKAGVRAGTLITVNRWSDAARAAAYASRKAGGNYPGWSDAARAAALAVRRAKAAARGIASGGTYADGSPVIRDAAGEMADYASGYDPDVTYLGDGDPVARRQAEYAAALRQWWDGVETTSENIARFNEYVAAFGGAAAAAAGAANPAGAARGAFGARYGGQRPVYNAYGEVVGWASPGRAGAARRRGEGTAGGDAGGLSEDPLNNPKTSGDLALREAYGKYLEEIRGRRDEEMAARGSDPLGNPLFPADLFGPGERTALGLFTALQGLDPETPEERDAYEAAREGLNRYADLYERDMAEVADREGILGKVREAVEAFNRLRSGEASARETPGPYEGEEPPYFANGGVRETPARYGAGQAARAAREAARALGVLHGAYGAEEGGAAIPEALRGDYEQGLAEGARGYGYGITVPRDRAAVLNAARLFLKTAEGEDGYSPDHLNDRHNLEKWESADAWNRRNSDARGTGDPDTRGQYGAPGLMRAAMDWFSGAMARGDRAESNAALSYMGDMLVSLSADKASAAEAVKGGEAGEEAPEIDERMPEFDEDGAEADDASPWDAENLVSGDLPPGMTQAEFDALVRRFRMANRGRCLANAGWTDEARAASLAVRQAKAMARRESEPSGAAGRADSLKMAQVPEQRPSAFMDDKARAADNALRDLLKRRKQMARKASKKAEQDSRRRDAAAKRGASIRDKFGADGGAQNGAKLPPYQAAAGFSVPVGTARYYFNGRWYGGRGEETRLANVGWTDEARAAALAARRANAALRLPVPGRVAPRSSVPAAALSAAPGDIKPMPPQPPGTRVVPGFTRNVLDAVLKGQKFFYAGLAFCVKDGNLVLLSDPNSANRPVTVKIGGGGKDPGLFIIQQLAAAGINLDALRSARGVR